MRLFLLILCGLALCSGFWAALQFSKAGELYLNTPVGPPHQIKIITRSEAKKVMEYHGILRMEWSIPHKYFIFERNGEICKTRAFEILKEKK